MSMKPSPITPNQYHVSILRPCLFIGSLTTSTASHFQHISTLEVVDDHEADGNANNAKHALDIWWRRYIRAYGGKESANKNSSD